MFTLENHIIAATASVSSAALSRSAGFRLPLCDAIFDVSVTTVCGIRSTDCLVLLFPRDRNGLGTFENPNLVLDPLQNFMTSIAFNIGIFCMLSALRVLSLALGVINDLSEVYECIASELRVLIQDRGHLL